MKIIVPESIADLSVRQFQEIATTDDPLQQLAIACGVGVETIRSMETESLERVLAALGELHPNPEEHPVVPWVEISGKQHGFLPQWDDLTVGEYADLTTACDDFVAGLPRALSVMYRPVVWRNGEHYEVQPYTPARDLEPYREVSMAVALGAVGFFLRTGVSWLKSSAPYLRARRRAVAWMQSGGSTAPYTTSRREM